MPAKAQRAAEAGLRVVAEERFSVIPDNLIEDLLQHC